MNSNHVSFRSQQSFDLHESSNLHRDKISLHVRGLSGTAILEREVKIVPDFGKIEMAPSCWRIYLSADCVQTPNSLDFYENIF